jgi:NAD+ synthase (glutamine-hydrolysing)
LTAAGRAPSRPGFNLNLVGGQNELVFDGGSLVMDFAGQVASRYPQFQDGLFLRGR